MSGFWRMETELKLWIRLTRFIGNSILRLIKGVYDSKQSKQIIIDSQACYCRSIFRLRDRLGGWKG